MVSKKRCQAMLEADMKKLEKKKGVLQILNEGVTYRLKFKKHRKKDGIIEVVATLNHFSKDSVNMQILSASNICEGLYFDLSTAKHKAYAEVTEKGVKDTKWYEEAKKHEVDSFPTKILFTKIEEASIFEPDQAPLFIGHDYVSPKFKRDYFKA